MVAIGETGSFLMETDCHFHSDSDIHESRRGRSVYLRRNMTISPSGMYRCDIETIDSQNKTMTRETVYVGLYADGGSVA